MSSAALILFDIDGTLLCRAGPHHKRALEQAVLRVTGRSTSLETVPTHGKLDRDLLLLLLESAGLSGRARRAALPDAIALAQEAYLDSAPPDLRSRLCPGVSPLLESLGEQGFELGVVTGNLTAIGWRKLELAGIRSHFRLGAFSENASTRAALARTAIRHARRDGLIGRTTPIALIGDHPNDVQAAHANQIFAIATGTGLGNTPELRAARPHLFVEDFTRLAAADVATLLGHSTTARTKP